MTVDDARRNLHAWLEDLEGLRELADPSNPDMKDFMAAWKAALAKAKDAARDYAAAVGT